MKQWNFRKYLKMVCYLLHFGKRKIDFTDYLTETSQTNMVVHLLPKLSWKEKKNFEKIFVFFIKFTLFAEKMFLLGKKKICNEKNILLKKNFLHRKI